MNKHVVFKHVIVGQKFKANGQKWVKQSSRTAKPLFDCHFNFSYFRQYESVSIEV